MKIVFMGTPSYATAIFEKLLKSGIEVVALFTQPDKPVGRKQILTPPHIKQFCIDNIIQIDIFQPQKLRENSNVEILNNIAPDLIVVAAYGQILPKDILQIAPCINLHASILPSYRGASPIQESLLFGDKFTGVTAMMMDEGLDTGKILAISYVQIDNMQKIGELYEALSQTAADLTMEVIDKFAQLKGITQNNAKSSNCKKIKKEDGLITFVNANEIWSKFRAFCDWPGIFIENGLKLKELEFCEGDSKNKNGILLQIKNRSVIVGCETGSIEILTVAPPSKQQMNVVDYLRGKRLNVGDLLS